MTRSISFYDVKSQIDSLLSQLENSVKDELNELEEHQSTDSYDEGYDQGTIDAWDEYERELKTSPNYMSAEEVLTLMVRAGLISMPANADLRTANLVRDIFGELEYQHTRWLDPNYGP